jgi:hypothetical protein
MIHFRCKAQHQVKGKFCSIAVAIVAICLTPVALVTVNLSQEGAIAAKPSPKSSPAATQKPTPQIPAKISEPWATYNAQQGKFTIFMPTKTGIISKTMPMVDGQKVAIWGVVGQETATPNTFYGVLYMDFASMPAEVSEQLAQDALDNGVRNFLTQGKRQLIARSRFALDRNPGQEIRYRLKEKPGFTGRSRIFLVGNRLYMLMVETDQESAIQTKIDQFMQSFKLI